MAKFVDEADADVKQVIEDVKPVVQELVKKESVVAALAEQGLKVDAKIETEATKIETEVKATLEARVAKLEADFATGLHRALDGATVRGEVSKLEEKVKAALLHAGHDIRKFF